MKKKIIIAIINALFLIAFLVCQLLSASIIMPMHNQQAAKAWAGQSGERFAQLSVFFPLSYSFTMDTLGSTRYTISNELTKASIAEERGRTLYADAWSAYGSVSIIGDRGTTPTTAPVIGVGGDFFLFHPLVLRSGSYLSPNDVMKDRVLLDEDLAWRLFGGVQLAGMEVLINNRPFAVAGVVSRESDFATAHVYDGGAGLYMPYEVLNEMMNGAARITSYEIVLPDPITDFGLNIISDIFMQDDIHIVQNTSRFSFGKLFEMIYSVEERSFTFGERSMRITAISYPYWENAARYAEDWLVLILAVSVLLLAFPAVCAVIYTVILIRFAIRKLKDLVRGIIKKRDARAYKRYKQKQDTL
ncbi:MAG: ABC transporter permease [Oscillospiraceae bacterium]|nr:ABC transporter permease [Oscillospiraceae bacterium]